MSDEEALLQAIYANADEDTPRLVYADWLDEHGQSERAEFIRLQVELAYIPDEDPREPPLRARRWELWHAHCAQWIAELGIVEHDKIEVEFRRGFIDELTFQADIPGAVDLVCRVPGVRRVRLWGVALTPDAVRRLAALALDELKIGETPFPVEWLELLEPLPCGTVLDIMQKDEPFAPEVWREFQSRRIGRLAQLAPTERVAEARRWQRGHDENNGYTYGPKTVRLRYVKACDAEMPLLAALPGVEEVRISDSDLTTAGVEHIAQLQGLKRLDLWSGRFQSIAPLARCITLEELRVWPEYGSVVNDAGTEGLERLVNLRELLLRHEYGELTLARLGALHKLVSLDIELRDIENVECFAALSQLTALEKLEIDGEVPGGALRYLAPCRKLQTITFRVPTGVATDFAALGILMELRKVQIKGDAVTDDAIRYLATCQKLRTLLLQRTRVTPTGAQWLADQLPEVTVILNETVAKSPRHTMTFCRRLAAEEQNASALVPLHWSGEWVRTNVEYCDPLTEDGWEDPRFINYEVVGPAEIRLYVRDETDPQAVLKQFMERGGSEYPQRIEERDVVGSSGMGTSYVISEKRSRSLVVLVPSEGKCAVLECDVRPARFEGFRPLFLFVARSLRVGEAARGGVGEEVTVPVSEL